MALLTRIRTVFTGVAGTPWYSNQYWALGSGGAQPQIDDTVTFWEDMAVMIKSTITATVEGTCAVIESTTGETVGVSSNDDGAVTFTGSGDLLPLATQGLITLRTGTYVGGREIRGKIYVPGLTEEYTTSGIINATGVGLMQAAAEGLLDESSEAWHVYSPTKNTSAEVVSVAAAGKPAVLRSRRD